MAPESKASSGLRSLSEREREVLGLIGRGLTSAEIATRLHRSIRTIESHRYKLGIKLGVSNRVELARIAIEAGLAPLQTQQLRDSSLEIGRLLRAEVAKVAQAQRAFQAIGAGTASATTGEEFFRSLAQHLAVALEVKYAFVAELIGDPPTTARTIAFWADQEPGETLQYPLAGTPCNEVTQRGLCFFPEGLQELFPDDHWLAEKGIESYLGTPLFDAAGKVIGLLCVMHTKPMSREFQPDLILRIFAARAAAELQRLHVEIALRQSEQRYRSLAEASLHGITETDLDGIYTFSNRVHAQMLGYEPEELVGKSIFDILSSDQAREKVRRCQARILEGRPPPVPCKMQVCAKDGSKFAVRVAWAYKCDARGKLIGFVSMVTRITANAAA